jgi:beta-glucosidase
MKYKDTSLSSTERAQELLNLMTLEEKVAQMDMIRGVELATKVHEAHFCSVDENSDFYWDKVENNIGKKGMGFVHDVYSSPTVLNKLQRYMVEETRLGIPCIFTGEALHGISYPGATVFPMPINMGATFHPELTKEVGAAIAAETRSLGIHEILAPNLDLAREPRWGRVEETFGEDTYLSSKMAYAIITGEQGEDISQPDKIVCEPKHYCVHGIPEGGTNCSPARVGTREIETSYLPVFEAGIKAAGAYNAMASYNCIDGEAVIASDYYLRTILKERYGMKGYVRADFGAINRLKTSHYMTTDSKDSICMAVNAGLDVQGFDFPNKYWEDTLIELVEEGRITMEIIDEAVLRILFVKFELGLFEQPYTNEENYKEVVRSEKHRNLTYEVAKESIVMLQNKNNLLPLKKDIPSIALIGPSSGQQRIGSYSSVPHGYQVESLTDVIKRKVGPNTKVLQHDGCSISDWDIALVPKNWYADGVHMEYYNNPNFDGDPIGSNQMNSINFNWILAKPHRDLEFTGYSVRMTALLKINTHDFTNANVINGKLVFTTEDSVRVYIDGNCVIDSVGKNKKKLPQCAFSFVDGAEHTLVVEYVCDVNGNNVTLSMDFHEDSLEGAVMAAKMADVVVLVCGDDKVTSGEGMDRSELQLYGKQRELIKQVCALNKPTILVLENGKPVDLSYEAEQMDSILVAWFGGERGALAIADVLFGEVSPSGKLPISFPKDIGQVPCYYSMLPGGSTEYLEGTRKPLFSFGHGLSYCDFEYTNLEIMNQEDHMRGYEYRVKQEDYKTRYEYKVTLVVKNLGTMEAEEVVQLYLQDLQSSIVTPLKLLKAFDRVKLLPGESKIVTLSLDFDSFKLLNRNLQWVVEPGDFSIMVGASSEDIRLSEKITIN